MTAYNQAFVNPYLKRFFWAQEPVTAGTSLALANAGWNIEACQDLRTVLNHTNYEANEYIGVPAMPLDVIELTHFTQGTVQCPFRGAGFPAFALASILGDVSNTGTADTVSGTTPKVHTIIPGYKGTRCNTFSVVHDTGALPSGSARGDNSLLFTYCTVSSVQLSFAYNTPLNATVSFVGSFPGQYATAYASQTVGIVGSPSGAVAVPVARNLGYQGTFNFYANASATAYAAKVISGDITISRQVDPFYTTAAAIANPYDFLPGPLQLTANLTLLFDSIQASTAYLDWMKSNRVGSSTNPNTLVFADNPVTQGVEIDFYPAKWTALDFQDGTSSRTLTGTLTGFQDYSQAIAATPVITVPSQVVIKNAVTTSMIN